jgi:GxxExxY protein
MESINHGIPMSTDTLKGDGSEQGLLHKEITGAIIGAAMHVLNTLKPGLDEKLYEKALIIELRKRGHRVNDQIGYPVYYDQQLIGELIPDLIVDDLVIVDTKTVSCLLTRTLPKSWDIWQSQACASDCS